MWDFWIVDDGEQYHLFFLYASRAFKDPHARHYRASVGHAVSSDLIHWKRVADALVRSDAPAFDELATWTGSVLRHPDGRWFMFYTGARLNEVGANVQSIGYDHCPRQTRRHHGPRRGRHAWSADLETWELREPRLSPGQGFGQLEVVQPFVVDGRDVLLFNCMGGDMPEAARAGGVTGGVWIADVKSPLGPYDIAGAQVIDDPSLYVGKFVTERETGDPKLLGFVHDRDGAFVGESTDLYAVTWDGIPPDPHAAPATMRVVRTWSWS